MFEYKSDYMFNRSDRLGNDTMDVTQNTIQNSKYLNSIFSQYQTENNGTTSVDFATKIPGMNFSGTSCGSGLCGSSVDHESDLFWKTESERPLERLQLQERPFLTIPYLGRGSVDTNMESQLMQGETIRGKKSVTTVMENNFYDLNNYPLDPEKKESTIEELALDGWTRGGKSARDMQENYFSQKSKPLDSGF